jgi:hypothetical protein
MCNATDAGHEAPAARAAADRRLPAIPPVRHVWLILFGVAAVATLLLPFLWKTVANPYIEAPDFGTSISSVIQGLHALDSRYAAAIQAQHSFKNVSSMAALMVGAAAVAAGVLRAPQLVIIGLGALSALLYGTLSLFYSQAAMGSMVTARSKLACINVASSAFLQGDKEARADTPKLQSIFAHILPALQDESARLTVFTARLKDVSAFKTKERAAALQQVDVMLSHNIADHNPAIELVQKRLYGVQSVLTELSVLPLAEKDRFPPGLVAELDLAWNRLERASADLRRPSDLVARMTSVQNQYVDQVAAADEFLNRGQRLAEEAGHLTALIPGAETQINAYAEESGRAASAVVAAVATVHADVVRVIAQSEPTPEATRQMIAAATAGLSKGGLPPAGFGPESPFLPGPSPPPPPPPPPPPQAVPLKPVPLAQIKAQARAATDAANEGLRQVAAQQGIAQRESTKLRPVFENDVPILAGTGQFLQKATEEVKIESENISQLLYQGAAAYQATRLLMHAVDLQRVASDVGTCASGLTAAALPATLAHTPDGGG